MWHDNETDKDFLGFVVHEKLVRSVITNDANLPVTFGLFGDWGSGKSSLMKLARQKIEERDKTDKQGDDENEQLKTLCIEFNGWLFEG